MTLPQPEEDLAQLYAEVGRRMTAMLRGAQSRGATGTARHIEAQARQLADLLEKLDGDSAEWVREQIPEQYGRAAGQAQYTLQQAGVPIAEAGYTGFDRRAMRAVSENISADLGAVRAAITTGLGLGDPSHVTFRHIQEALGQEGLVQLRRGQAVVQVPSGKFWGAGTYSRMLARTAVADSRRVAFRERYLANGVDLVEVVANGTIHPICAFWEGEILSLTGRTPGYPTVGDARAAGLFHPNCAHRYVVATGVSQPEVPTERQEVPPPEVPLPTLGLQPRTPAEPRTPIEPRTPSAP